MNSYINQRKRAIEIQSPEVQDSYGKTVKIADSKYKEKKKQRSQAQRKQAKNTTITEF